LALPAFRPGWLGMLLAFLLIPQVSEAFSWENLWFRPDQQGVRALERDAPEDAAALFQDPGWKGIAHYQAGKYQKAEEAFSTVDTPEGHYNRGNALANLGRYEEALASYQTALTQQPHLVDAQHNMEVIKKLLEKQSSSKQEGQHSQQSDSSSSKQENEGDDARADGKESAQASDSTHEQSESGKGDSQKGKQEEPERLTGSRFDPSENQNQSEKDQKTAGKNMVRETQEPESSKADQSKNSMPSASAMEEKPGDQGEKSEVASTVSAEQTSETQKSEQALQQWLRRIPDDPGGLLRRKFLLEHQRRVASGKPVPPQERRW
jgi:Ca-activated chloride channel family protein